MQPKVISVRHVHDGDVDCD